ncbi:MAG: hypothetical protein A2V88_11695 [Elusimicrobia bacterium RBG_16_66_12]|nr:MAG: hypothetical protein A2V88_11695 [Elusimicrobia bacterium RBG_16_66_12]
MSVRLFCVDGTNLVRTAYGYGGPAHAAQEEADAQRLAAIMAQVCEDADGAVEVELFFDGAFRLMPVEGPAGFRVRFTREVTADELILDRVRSRAWGGGGPVTVVTADGELGRLTQAEGGKWLRVAHGTPAESVARKMGGRFSR